MNRRIRSFAPRPGGPGRLIAFCGAVAAGCRSGPDITVAGSYFPSWMAALAIGVLGTAMCWQLFARIGIDPYLGPRTLVYAGLVILITLVVWQGVFRG